MKDVIIRDDEIMDMTLKSGGGIVNAARAEDMDIPDSCKSEY